MQKGTSSAQIQSRRRSVRCRTEKVPVHVDREIQVLWLLLDEGGQEETMHADRMGAWYTTDHIIDSDAFYVVIM